MHRLLKFYTEMSTPNVFDKALREKTVHAVPREAVPLHQGGYRVGIWESRHIKKAFAKRFVLDV